MFGHFFYRFHHIWIELNLKKESEPAWTENCNKWKIILPKSFT